MGDTPTIGSVKVVLKLDTDEAKKKASEVERKLKANEQERATFSAKIKKEAQTPKAESFVRPNTPHFRALREHFRKTGGPPANASAGDVLWAMGGYKLGPMPQKEESLASKVVNKAFGKVNPFQSQVSGDNVGNVLPTLALASALYKGADTGSKSLAMALAYLMKSGFDASQSVPGQFLNELNGTFSYANNYFKSWKESFKRADEWDSTVAAVTGRLPDTFFYRPKFSRMAQFEMEFADLISRNAAQTKAGAIGNSGVTDQLRDAFFMGMNR